MVLTIQFRNICVNITQGTHTLMQILSSVRNKHLLSVYFGQNWEFALKCVYPYYFITIVKFFLPTDSAYCVVLPLCRPCYPLDFIHSFLETNQWIIKDIAQRWTVSNILLSHLLYLLHKFTTYLLYLSSLFSPSSQPKSIYVRLPVFPISVNKKCLQKSTKHIKLLVIINKLQRTQNNAARAVLAAKRHSDAKPLLRQLHWLPVRQRIQYKVAVLTRKVRMTGAPSYLSQHLVQH